MLVRCGVSDALSEPVLVHPTIERREEYLDMLDRARALGENGDGYTLVETGPIRRSGGAKYLKTLDDFEAGVRLPDGWVPVATRWLLNADGRLAGETRLRFKLTDALEVEGGHVGYFIHPDHRRRGLGHAILRLALKELRAAGVSRVLVTCNDDNFRSRRVIQAAGGAFRRHTISPRSRTKVATFWIDERVLPE